MSAEQILQEGKPQQALEQLQQQVRGKPADPKLRVFLFQVLAVLGQWGRALTQLNVAADLDPGTLAMVQTYREALRCEVLREEVFAGQRSPIVFGEPEQWIALLTEALRLTAEGEYTRSQEVRGQALELAPAIGGQLDGSEFEWIADADTRLGPILEAVINGRYYWIPFHRIRAIHIEEPEDLRDAVWTPAYFTWANGGETVGLIPTRYPGTPESSDGQILLAHKTEWTGHEADVYLGLGQRLLVTDGGDFPLMDIRAIELNSEGMEAEREPSSQA